MHWIKRYLAYRRELRSARDGFERLVIECRFWNKNNMIKQY